MPSRVYVGVVVFGLIASLAILAYVTLVVAGYRPPADAPHEILFPAPDEKVPGQTLFLVLAAGFSIAFTFLAGQALLRGAREEEAFQRMRPELEAELKRRQRQKKEGGPPGYS